MLAAIVSGIIVARWWWVEYKLLESVENRDIHDWLQKNHPHLADQYWEEAER